MNCDFFHDNFAPNWICIMAAISDSKYFYTNGNNMQVLDYEDHVRVYGTEHLSISNSCKINKFYIIDQQDNIYVQDIVVIDQYKEHDLYVLSDKKKIEHFDYRYSSSENSIIFIVDEEYLCYYIKYNKETRTISYNTHNDFHSYELNLHTFMNMPDDELKKKFFKISTIFCALTNISLLDNLPKEISSYKFKQIKNILLKLI